MLYITQVGNSSIHSVVYHLAGSPVAAVCTCEVIQDEETTQTGAFKCHTLGPLWAPEQGRSYH